MTTHFATSSSSGRRFLRPLAALLAALGSAGLLPSAALALELAYSFELDAEGFTPNPPTGGVSVSQDTIGATEGSHSLKFDIEDGQTFVGAVTDQFDSAIIGNPPGLDFFVFDLTITEAFTGTFADLGMTFFGDSKDGTLLGAQVQFIQDQIPLGALEPGTYTNLVYDLTRGNFHPKTFQFPASFNDVFGQDTTDLNLTGFQFYVSLAGGPITIYLDNVRAGQIVEGDYNLNGVVDAADYTVWRDNLGLGTEEEEEARFYTGDGNGDGVVTEEDYTFWADRFGNTTPVVSAAFAVPEPAALSVLLAALACPAVGFPARRRR